MGGGRPRGSLVLLVLVGGCSFQGKNASGTGTLNTCSVSSDCAAGSDCQQGLCVARKADVPLTIALQVTPQRLSDGSDPLPVTLDSFTLKGADTRTFTLPARTSVRGTVRSGGNVVDAQLSFTPAAGVAGIRPSAVSVAVSSGSTSDGNDYAVQLLSGVQYRMLVLPTSGTLPPYHTTFTAGADPSPEVDYETLQTQQQVFSVDGVSLDRPLTLTAFDRASGERISSTAMVGKDGTATLTFGPDPPDARLELRAMESYDAAQALSTSSSGGACDGDTPVIPVFSVAQAELPPATNGVTHIALPQTPQRIRYEGSVDLCKEQGGDGSDLSKLPVTLHSRSLLLDSAGPVSASFDATTDASYDQQSGQLRFCVLVMPGDYDVLVTPPSSVRCALFAEERLIQGPDGMDASGALLELPSPAYLKGTLQTTDLAPLQGATVEAAALGRSGDIELSMGDHSVTRYNRSQQTSTTATGEFKLPVDLGSYDVVIRPPPDSGFPWQVRHDVDIGARGVEFATVIDMLSPVPLDGTLALARGGSGGSASLSGAQIDAYAVIDVQADGVRAIQVGKTVADATGHFMLLLPPSTHRGW